MQGAKEPAASEIVTATRVYASVALDACTPASAWHSADPVRFAADWQGENQDFELETEVRVLWSPETLYLRFVCGYRELCVFNDAEANGRRDQLWEHDVVEAFLQPPDLLAKSASVIPDQGGRGSPSRYRAFYKEFEVAPNGAWLDLDISPRGPADLKSGLNRSAYLDEERKIWVAELAIPVRSITPTFDPALPWRANFYRVEGKSEPRCYLAWQPTRTSEPDFHVPEAFGTLRFVE